jgi:hypothetical protein
MPPDVARRRTMPHVARECRTMPHVAREGSTIPHVAKGCRTMPHVTEGRRTMPVLKKSIVSLEEDPIVRFEALEGQRDGQRTWHLPEGAPPALRAE